MRGGAEVFCGVDRSLWAQARESWVSNRLDRHVRNVPDMEGDSPPAFSVFLRTRVNGTRS